MLTIEQVAEVAHEVNRAYCVAYNDGSQPNWADAPDWQKDSAINGVQFHLEGTRSPEESHRSWLREKKAAGWTYGPIKDADAKTHPCMLPYNELPVQQRAKDHIFRAVVESLKQYVLPVVVAAVEAHVQQA